MEFAVREKARALSCRLQVIQPMLLRLGTTLPAPPLNRRGVLDVLRRMVWAPWLVPPHCSPTGSMPVPDPRGQPFLLGLSRALWRLAPRLVARSGAYPQLCILDLSVALAMGPVPSARQNRQARGGQEPRAARRGG